jgi:prepilin-type N-terminal cleavage/methylation domain-containing protein
VFKIKGRAGFTLTEILITLGIIGVVAAVTIPMVVANYQTMQRVSQVKKIYSEFANATKQVVDDNNGTLMGRFIQYVYDPVEAYSPYFHINKTCPMGNANGTDKCFHSAFKYLNGTDYAFMATLSSRSSGYILDNGMLVLFYGGQGASKICTVDGNPDSCNIVMIDINGWKQPNTVGYDIFWFVITTNSFVPVSKTRYPTIECIFKPAAGWNGVNNAGYTCSSTLLLQ